MATSHPVNGARANQIRQTTFGKDMREPIANGLEWGDAPLKALKLHARAQTVEAKKEGKAKLDQKVSWGKYQLHVQVENDDDRLDEAYDKAHATLIPIPSEAHSKLVPINQKCDTRVSDMAITRFSKRSEYYTLSFTRANGQ